MGDGGEIVIGEHQISRFAGGVRALVAHGNADVGCLERRRVIDTVASHGHQLALRLQRGHEPQLVLGAGTGKHVGLQGHALQRQLVQSRHRLAGQGALGLQAQLPTDGGRRDDVVAGNHLDAHAGTLAFGHGRNRFVPGWIDQADQPEQGKTPGGDVVHGQRRGARGHLATRQRQHALPGLRGLGHARVPRAVILRRRFGVGHAQRDHALRRAFEVDENLPGMVMVQGGHEAIFRFERDFVDAWRGSGGLQRVQPGLVGQGQQGAFGRVTHQQPAGLRVWPELGVVAQQGAVRQLLQGRVLRHVHRLAVALKPPFRRVTGATDLQRARGQHHLHGGHLVAREGAGLVRADHRDGAQGFHRGQTPHDGVFARHAASAQGQHDGHDGRQAFRDGRDGQAHHRQKDIEQRHLAHPIAVAKGDQAGRENEQGDLARKLIEPARQRRHQRLHLPDQLADAANFGALAGAHHQAVGLADADHRAAIRHAVAVADGGIAGHRFRVLVSGQGLAGQGRFVDAQVLDPQQPQVRGDTDTGLQQHDIAGHQQGRIDVVARAAAQHGGATGQHGAHRVQRLFRLAFLNEADAGIDQYDPGNHARVHIVLQAEGDDAGAQQHVDQRIVKLQHQPQPGSAPARGGQAVAPITRHATGDFLGTQAGTDVNRQFMQGFICGQRVPHGGGVRDSGWTWHQEK